MPSLAATDYPENRIPDSRLTRPSTLLRLGVIEESSIGLLQHSLPARGLLVASVSQAYARSTLQPSSAREEFRSYPVVKDLNVSADLLLGI